MNFSGIVTHIFSLPENHDKVAIAEGLFGVGMLKSTQLSLP